jgi:uncharacterized membrane protein YedE/YeeE
MRHLDLAMVLLSASGGVLIGLAAAMLLVFDGRIAGVSGVVGRLFDPTPHSRGWRFAFLAGLLLGGAMLSFLAPGVFGPARASSVSLIAAGLLVGVGTQVGNGCTSGHGVCGIGRGSKRSIVATLVFMTTAALAVAIAGV